MKALFHRRHLWKFVVPQIPFLAFLAYLAIFGCVFERAKYGQVGYLWKDLAKCSSVRALVLHKEAGFKQKEVARIHISISYINIEQILAFKTKKYFEQVSGNHRWQLPPTWKYMPQASSNRLTIRLTIRMMRVMVLASDLPQEIRQVLILVRKNALKH